MRVNYGGVNMLVLLLIAFPFASCNETVEYLVKYGYIEENALTENIVPAVKQFQEIYQLEPTGIIDNKTLELMARPRCGNKDNLLPFAVIPTRKWNFTEITWYFYGTTQYNDLVQKAFEVWGKHTNLVFKKSFVNPTIYISFSGNRHHLQYSRQDYCHYDFDGPGLILGHAFVPTSYSNQTDIHMDSDENWDFSMDLPRYGKPSFFHVLIHEIGHALGLDHSYDNQSVMFPYHKNPVGIANMNEFELSRDDRHAVQFLYGTHKAGSTTTTSSTTTSSTTTSSTTTSSTTTSSTTTQTPIPPQPIEERDICDLKDQIDTYLIVNKKIFAFYRNYVWIISLDPVNRIPEEYKNRKE